MKTQSIIFAFILLLSISNVNAQTQEETRDWIEYKLQDFGNSNNLDVEIDMFYFQASYLTVNGSVSYGVKIYKIWSIEFIEKEKSINLVIRTKEVDGVMKILSNKNGNMESITQQKEFIIELDKSFKGDDRFNRMRKAITHLVETNGGSVLKESF